MEFAGFSPETIDFLWGIRFNNNREWFNAHKPAYQKYLYEPMKALSAQVAEPFAAVPHLRMKLSRIYRDMRMHPPTPYKESLWFSIRREGDSWMDLPCLFFEITPEGYSYGMGMWCQRAASMEALRAKMTAKADEFLQMVARAEAETDLKLWGSTYARPKPCPDERLLPYFRLKNLSAWHDRPADDLLFSPALADEVTRTFLAWHPVAEFCTL